MLSPARSYPNLVVFFTLSIGIPICFNSQPIGLRGGSTRVRRVLDAYGWTANGNLLLLSQ